MKEKRSIKETMGFPVKKQLKEEKVMEEIAVSKAVNRLHSQLGEVTRLSLDISTELYPQLKMRQIQKGYKTTREYLLSLIEADLASS